MKLLIVDDSSVSRMVIKGRILALKPDWEIIDANDGHEAILSTQEKKPDYITMDVNMPGMDGFSAIEQIRKFDKSVKIVLLTANIQESSKEKAKELVVHFIAKPATPVAILDAVNYFSEPTQQSSIHD